ncbi:MAG: bifunctional 5,10-methylenetetrahydrofolate dehydrogenase/5,10-methenyltetrahydrofolate cyclohydrolase [Promethearchaeia archaeon]
MEKILDGKSLANQLNEKLAKQIDQLYQKTNIQPTLATILVGADPASEIYLKIKHRTCKSVGINSITIKYDQSINKEQLLNKIQELNQDESIHGILLQLPLPDYLKPYTSEFLSQISPEKDVDGFHPINRGKLFDYKEDLVACTPKGIITLLEHYDIDLAGKDITIINHSNLVGKPLLFMCLKRDATVSICHIATEDLQQYTKIADILVVAVGKAKFITENMIKKGAIIIDVGINRIEGEIYGDVDFDDVYEKCSLITPVPGGVGPMTVHSLMRNTIIAYKKQIDSS